jgi:hypothetical protein
MLSIEQNILIDLARILVQYMEINNISGVELTKQSKIHTTQIAHCRKLARGDRDFSKIKLHYTVLIRTLMDLGFNIHLHYENKNYRQSVEWPLQQIA